MINNYYISNEYILKTAVCVALGSGRIPSVCYECLKICCICKLCNKLLINTSTLLKHVISELGSLHVATIYHSRRIATLC